MPLVLDELLDEAPVTWARSYGGPLLPPMMLREPITDFPLDIPKMFTHKHHRSAASLIQTLIRRVFIKNKSSRVFV